VEVKTRGIIRSQFSTLKTIDIPYHPRSAYCANL